MVTHWRDTRKGSRRFWAIPTDEGTAAYPACREITGIVSTGAACLGHTAIWDRRELQPMTIAEAEILRKRTAGQPLTPAEDQQIRGEA